MMFLQKETTGLWVIDMQEKLFPHISRSREILEKICYMIEVAKALKFSIFVTEQAPDKLGNTIAPIRKRLPEGQIIYPKTAFSGFYDPTIREAIIKTEKTAWILVGIEAHICVLQAAKDLVEAGKEVIVLKDGVSSRSDFDSSTAIEELHVHGARISSAETIIYECIRDAHSETFKELFALLKAHA